MIGSHDSFTYKKPNNPIWSLFSFMWRTQNKSLEQQYASGVRYFDIRIRRTKQSWQPCHGLVDLGVGTFPTLYSLVNTLEFKLPNSYFRIILERGDDSEFKKEVPDIITNHKVVFIGIKKDWKVLKDKECAFLIDYSWVPFKSNYSIINNIKNWWNTTRFSTIKSWAKKNNPEITELIKDNNIVYFMDFV